MTDARNCIRNILCSNSKKNGEWKKQSKEVMTADKTVIARYQKVMDKYNAELDDTQNVKRFALVADIWSESTKFLIPIQ